MTHFFRVLLIRIAKILPFVVCGIVAISYFETIVSLSLGIHAKFDDCIVPYKPISWTISNVFEYDWTVIIILTVLSIAVETCVWNRLAILYLGINLCEKSFFDFEMDLWQIYIICMANIIISTFLIYKGTKNVLK